MEFCGSFCRFVLGCILLFLYHQESGAMGQNGSAAALFVAF